MRSLEPDRRTPGQSASGFRRPGRFGFSGQRAPQPYDHDMAGPQTRRAQPELETSGRPLRARQRLFTKEVLLTAAVEVFTESGYAAAKIEDIAKAAGTSRPTFYQHFRSKSEVAIELLNALKADVEPLHEELFATGEPTWESVRAWIEESAETWERLHVQASIVRQAAILDPAVSALLAGFAVAQIDTMAEYLRTTTTPARSREDARIHAALLLSSFETALNSLQLLGISPREGQVVDAIADNWWAVLSGNAPARGRPHDAGR